MSETSKITDFQSTLLRVSSEDKTAQSLSNSDFTVNFRSLGGVVDNVKGVVIKSITSPNQFYNIPSYKNQLFISDSVGTSYTITLTPDNYTIAELITEMTTKINTAITTDSVVITLNATNHLLFTFTGDSYDFVYGTPNNADDQIGLTEDTANLTAVTMQSVPNLTGVTEIFIHSRTIARNNLTEADGSFSVADVLDLDVEFGVQAYSKFNEVESHKIEYFPWESRRSFRQIDIRLRDRVGNILEYSGDNFHFSMILKIYYRL
jgi:hypothetical protein